MLGVVRGVPGNRDPISIRIVIPIWTHFAWGEIELNYSKFNLGILIPARLFQNKIHRTEFRMVNYAEHGFSCSPLF